MIRRRVPTPARLRLLFRAGVRPVHGALAAGGRMRISLMIDGQDGVTCGRWLQLARAAEANGLEGLFSSDHYLALRAEAREGSLETWSVLAALAARTERIRLGTMV